LIEDGYKALLKKFRLFLVLAKFIQIAKDLCRFIIGFGAFFLAERGDLCPGFFLSRTEGVQLLDAFVFGFFLRFEFFALFDLITLFKNLRDGTGVSGVFMRGLGG
jgi:hypothetical protein